MTLRFVSAISVKQPVFSAKYSETFGKLKVSDSKGLSEIEILFDFEIQKQHIFSIKPLFFPCFIFKPLIGGLSFEMLFLLGWEKEGLNLGIARFSSVFSGFCENL